MFLKFILNRIFILKAPEYNKIVHKKLKEIVFAEFLKVFHVNLVFFEYPAAGPEDSFLVACL